jgi:hypothetical protein
MKRRLRRGTWIFAIELAGAMLAKFFDAENGGFWQSAADSEDLILRVKDDYDGAEPSGNSVAALSLLKLGAITGRKISPKPPKKPCACSRTAAKFSAGDAVHAARAGFFTAGTEARGHRRKNRFAQIPGIAARRAFGLSAEQNCSGQHRRGGGICLLFHKQRERGGETVQIIFSPTGPISPLPKNPARPNRAKLLLHQFGVVVGRPKRFFPRPLQQHRQPP